MSTSNKSCDFKVQTFQRRTMSVRDIVLEITHCGICHTDLHTAHGDLAGVAPMHYPCVPGHELAGVCIAVGSEVTRVKVGDHIGVGCIVDSCLECDACKRGEEQKCKKMVGTYNASDKGSGRALNAPGNPYSNYTLGGYTNKFVVDERFAVLIPRDYPLEYAGPIMCAGTTLFDPLRRYGAKEGTRVGVVGLGGLGSIGIKIAKAMGCIVTAITSSNGKIDFAKKLGSDRVLVSSNKDDMKAAQGSLDLVLNTISVEHDYNEYSKLLTGKGLHVILGLNSVLGALLTFGSGSRLTMSVIGGIESSQAVIDLCAKHKIFPEISIVGVDGINAVYSELSKGNTTGVRYVIDLKTINEAGAKEKCAKVAAPSLQPHVSGMTISTIMMTSLDMWWNGKAK